MRKPSLGNAFFIVFGAFLGSGLQKASSSIGLIRFFDMAQQHAIYSEKPNAFSSFWHLSGPPIGDLESWIW